MAKIKQYQGPFNKNEGISLNSNTIHKIGISIDEKDFMELSEDNQSFIFYIDDEQIWMGRTCMYECEYQTDSENGHQIQFKQDSGAPASCLVNITLL